MRREEWAVSQTAVSTFLSTLLISHIILIEKAHNTSKIWPKLYVYMYVNKCVDLMAQWHVWLSWPV